MLFLRQPHFNQLGKNLKIILERNNSKEIANSNFLRVYEKRTGNLLLIKKFISIKSKPNKILKYLHDWQNLLQIYNFDFNLHTKDLILSFL